MKRLISLTLSALLLCTLLCTACFGSGLHMVGDTDGQYIIDNESLLTEAEHSELNELAARISAGRACSVTILTVSSLNGEDVMVFAEDYFNEHALGWNGSDDGFLLCVSMGDRQYDLYASGIADPLSATSLFAAMQEEVESGLRTGDYAGAFRAYIEGCERLLNGEDAELYEDSDPIYDADWYYGTDDGWDYSYSGWGYDSGERMSDSGRTALGIIIALAIGVIGGLIAVSTMKGKLNNVRQNRTATSYVREGSMVLTVQMDRYVRTDTNRVRIQNDPPAGRVGGGGGSSGVHISSGGGSHHSGSF